MSILDSDLKGLIERSYDRAEAGRFSTFLVSREHIRLAAEAGEHVLRACEPTAGACTYMSAMWTAMLRDANMAAYCVAGDLAVRGRLAFGSTYPEVASHLDDSTGDWDAHCWVVLGDWIGDVSIFRSAYASPVNSNLRQAVVEEFGLGRGLFLMRTAAAWAAHFEYSPKHVVTEEQMTALINGAHASGRFKIGNGSNGQ